MAQNRINNSPDTFNPLPCRHQKKVISQIQPAIDLLRGMDTQHPDILRKKSIEPQDYHGSMVFRSAVESIRGSYIASSTPNREGFVSDVLDAMKQEKLIHDFDHLSASERWDFEVFLDSDDQYLAVIEVKGGEGNSINISERSRLVKEFAIWSHLDGSIQHHPSHGAGLIIGRITNELSRRGKHVDILLFRDVLCGTRARPCPKYPDREETIGVQTAPDMFLFPQYAPTLDNPEPPPHSLQTLRLPELILKHYKVHESEYQNHLWEVQLKLIHRPADDDRIQILGSVWHKGKQVFTRRGRPFRVT
jgi:hypothetical protein